MAGLFVQIPPAIFIRTAYKIDLVVFLLILAVAACSAWLYPPALWFQNHQARCPHCRSRDIRPSTASGFVHRLRKNLNIAHYRCKVCGQRFLNRRSSDGTHLSLRQGAGPGN